MDSKPSTSVKRKPNLPEKPTIGAMTGEGKRKKPMKKEPEPFDLDLDQLKPNPFESKTWKKDWIGITSICHRGVEPGPERFKPDQRFFRSVWASTFTGFCTLVKGGKFCISSSEFEAFVPPTAECCFDSSWVAVHGIHSICMVTCRKAMESASFCFPGAETQRMQVFSRAVISQVECIPYKDFGCKDEILRGKVGKPFAVVSLVVDTEKNWDEAKDPVSNFLYQRMRNSGLAFTDNETIQTAIGAFQQMCRGQELSAKDIWVTSMDISSGRVDHLDMDMITEQLDIVNNLSPTKSSLL